MSEFRQMPTLHLPIVGMAVSIEEDGVHYVYSVQTPGGTSLVQVSREMFEEMIPTFLKMVVGEVELVETGPMGSDTNDPEGATSGEADEDGFALHEEPTDED